MNTPLKKFPVRVFVNNMQLGDNATFAEWAADVDAAIAIVCDNSRAEGYEIQSVVVEQLPRWASSEPETTIVAHLTSEVRRG